MENTLKVLKFLATPFATLRKDWKLRQTDGPEVLLDLIITKCREKVPMGELGRQVTENGGPLTTSWKLVITILELLVQLKNEIVETERNQSEEQKSIEVLSIQAQLDVQNCVELLVGFGILPYLLPDVGVPGKVRKKNVAASELFLVEDHRLSPLFKFHRLAQVTKILLEVSSNPSISALVVPKHSADILSAMFQLCKSPIAKPSIKPGALSQEEYDCVLNFREQFQSDLNHFLTCVPKSLLINSLFLIGERPKFMRDVCTSTIQDILMSPNGLTTIASTLVNESSTSDVWNLSRVISSLMRSSLVRVSNQDEYLSTLSNMCDQCLQMITQTMESTRYLKGDLQQDARVLATPFQANKELNRIGLFCSIVLMDINRQMSKAFVWDHLFKPVVQLGLSQSQDQCEMKSINRNVSTCVQQLTRVNEDIITSVDIERVIGVSEVAEGLLSLVIPSGISIPVLLFQPVWSLLFQVLVACRKYLERKIQEPNLSQLAQVLNNKLENVFLLMLEVVSAGLGDKLDLNSGAQPNGTPTSYPGGAPNKVNTCTINNNISQEGAKTVCDFCIQLVLNESVENGKCNNNINRFELISSSQHSNSEQCDDAKEMVKIVRVSHHNSRNELKEPGMEACSSGCQSPTLPLNNTESNDTAEAANVSFEVLADECVILCSILKQERVAHITSQLFRQLLNYDNEDVENGQKQGQTFVSKRASLQRSDSSQCNGSKRKTTSNVLTQLELELGESTTNSSKLRKFVSLKLLQELGGDEQTIENCVKTDDYKDTLLIVELVMRKLATELRESSCSGETYEFSQTIVFALGFLGTIVETACSSSPQPQNKTEDDEFWNELQRFSPHLKVIGESDDLGLVNSGIPVMAENILMSIESRGKAGLLGKKDKVQVVESEFEKALKDVNNPMLPIKGHGLLQLRRLIEARDSETLKNDTSLLQIFQTELTNEDSYVYLMAIQGLASLGLKFHRIVIPILIQEYHLINIHDQDGSKDCKRSKMYSEMTRNERIESCLKIGEVLVKVIQQLGDMAPVYRVPLTNLFFTIVRDDEPLIRASALSNLGELCHLLKFSLGTVLTEVWFSVEGVLSCEKDVHVRRAALHLLVLLLKGVEKDFSADHLLTNVQLGAYLRDARRLLTKTQQVESDPVARTHAQLALHELELIVKKLLLPSQQLSYRISVLDAVQ